MSLCLMFIIDANCILCEARAETEGNIDDPNIVIEQYQYLPFPSHRFKICYYG
jgi:hypothetical protein